MSDISALVASVNALEYPFLLLADKILDGEFDRLSITETGGAIN
jgi:hypothetical protein